MISVEIRINGSVITVINAVNRSGSYGDRLPELSEYEYQGVRFPVNNKGAPTVFNGTLTHLRSDGAEVLCGKLLSAATGVRPVSSFPCHGVSHHWEPLSGEPGISRCAHGCGVLAEVIPIEVTRIKTPRRRKAVVPE